MVSMLVSMLLAAAASAPLVSAHGKIVQCVGDLGGNGTGLGIQGGIIPAAGQNGQTEVDTTVYNNNPTKTDSLGKTGATGPINAAMIPILITKMQTMSGPLLPQVTNSTAGFLTCIWQQVVNDGTGPIECVIDPTGQGKYQTSGVTATLSTNVPANNNKNAAGVGLVVKLNRRWNPLGRRANTGNSPTNVGSQFAFTVDMPGPLDCTGTFNNITGCCIMKCANHDNNNSWGSNVVFQPEPPGTQPYAGMAPATKGNVVGKGNAATGKGNAAKGGKSAAPTTPAPALSAPVTQLPAAATTVTVTTTVTTTVTAPPAVATPAPATVDDPTSPPPATGVATAEFIGALPDSTVT